MIGTQEDIERFERICKENNLSRKIAICSDTGELKRLFTKTIAEFAAEYMIEKILLIQRLTRILKERLSQNMGKI